MNQPPTTRRRSPLVWIVPLVLAIAILICAGPLAVYYRAYNATSEAPQLTEAIEIFRTIPGAQEGNFLRVAHALLFEQLDPAVRVLLFVAALIGGFSFAALLLVYEYFFLAVTGGGRRRSRAYIWLRRAILGIAGVGALCVLYGYFIEPYWLEVTRIQVESSKLPHGAHVRIVLISDLHMNRKARLESRLPGVIAAEKPDLIAFAGDALNTPADAVRARFKDFFLQLSRIAPVYAVKGNVDDGAYWEQWHIFQGTNAHELTGQAETLDVRGATLWIRGAGKGHYETMPDLPPPPDKFSIFLFHTPDEILPVARDHYDLYLCGHTHGGQIALPFYGALLTYSDYDKAYESGLYRLGSTTLYVSRGIGLAKWPQPEARFFSRPEVTLLDVVGK